MTTLQQTADIAVGRQSTTGRRATLNPLAAVVLAAAVAGGIVGGALTAVASQTVFSDRAAEHARLVKFREELKAAQRWDDLYKQMHPYVQ